MKKDADPSNKYHNQSIMKAISALKLFSHTEYELSISTIAERLEMPISTTHRILNTLESVGYISKTPTTGNTGSGSAVLSLEATCGSIRKWRRRRSRFSKSFRSGITKRSIFSRDG